MHVTAEKRIKLREAVVNASAGKRTKLREAQLIINVNMPDAFAGKRTKLREARLYNTA